MCIALTLSKRLLNLFEMYIVTAGLQRQTVDCCAALKVGHFELQSDAAGSLAMSGNLQI